MNKAKVVREALRLALERDWLEASFYSCNLLQRAAFNLFRQKVACCFPEHESFSFLAELQAEYAALFDDASFWVETRQDLPYRSVEHIPQYERNFDRACCLMMFAEILE